MPFSRRRMYQRELKMFSKTGNVMVLWIRVNPPTPTASADLFVDDTEPLEGAGDLKKMYIIGTFQEEATESQSAVGRLRHVRGVITIPAMYKTYLEQATYIDPYNDGSSRFRKNGSVMEEERLFVTQKIESVVLKNLAGE